MNNGPVVEIRLGRRTLVALALAATVALAAFFLPGRAAAQKVQENFKDKLSIAAEDGGIAVATSGDGKYVYVVGPAGVIVSDNFGQTGSWKQTVRLK
ncbi:MAG TPA: hypothetical protein VFQ07_17390 [Candidatus Polarisedimenticolia bacterium]|nr:hypothetical protein [Candidatus Polarisedimenticolia bacterium]